MFTRLFDLQDPFTLLSAFDRPGDWVVPSRRSEPKSLSFRETDDAFIAVAELPGISPDRVHIAVEGTQLSITVEPLKTTEDEPKLLRRERADRVMRRTWTLPVRLDADKTTADLENGVLTVTIPKAAAPVRRTVPIRSASTSN